MKKFSVFQARSKFEEKNVNTNGEISYLSVADIHENPYQPRRSFDEVDLVSLADSIRQHGLLQPITVRFSDDAEGISKPYVLVAGERRLRAVKMLSRDQIPCLILDITAREAAELAIIENIMRKDLSMFELAIALKTLIEEYELTQDELAKRLSTSQSNIANKLRLLRYSDAERAMIAAYGLTERHARAVLRLNDPDLRRKALVYIGERHLSVKLAENYIDSLLLPKNKRKGNVEAHKLCELYAVLRKNLKKPLDKLIKRGVQVTSEEIHTENETKIIITIPNVTENDPI